MGGPWPRRTDGLGVAWLAASDAFYACAFTGMFIRRPLFAPAGLILLCVVLLFVLAGMSRRNPGRAARPVDLVDYAAAAAVEVIDLVDEEDVPPVVQHGEFGVVSVV